MNTRRPPRALRAASPPLPTSDGLARLLSDALDQATSSPVLGPVRATTVVGETVDRLLTAVAMGEFLPGEAMPSERKLTEMLGISRVAVREALSQLDAVGVTEARRGRGGGRFVRTGWVESSAAAVRHTLLPRWQEIEQLLDLRALIEELVGRTAAERIDAAGLETVQDALEQYDRSETLRDEHVADARFHGAILESTGNDQLVALSRQLLARTSIAFPCEPWGNESMPADDPEFRDARTDHRQIYLALSARDVELTGHLCRIHFGITAAMFRAVMSQAQSGSDHD